MGHRCQYNDNTDLNTLGVEYDSEGEEIPDLMGSSDEEDRAPRQAPVPVPPHSPVSNNAGALTYAAVLRLREGGDRKSSPSAPRSPMRCGAILNEDSTDTDPLLPEGEELAAEDHSDRVEDMEDSAYSHPDDASQAVPEPVLTEQQREAFDEASVEVLIEGNNLVDTPQCRMEHMNLFKKYSNSPENSVVVETSGAVVMDTSAVPTATVFATAPLPATSPSTGQPQQRRATDKNASNCAHTGHTHQPGQSRRPPNQNSYRIYERRCSKEWYCTSSWSRM